MVAGARPSGHRPSSFACRSLSQSLLCSLWSGLRLVSCALCLCCLLCCCVLYLVHQQPATRLSVPAKPSEMVKPHKNCVASSERDSRLTGWQLSSSAGAIARFKHGECRRMHPRCVSGMQLIFAVHALTSGRARC